MKIRGAVPATGLWRLSGSTGGGGKGGGGGRGGLMPVCILRVDNMLMVVGESQQNDMVAS